MARNVSRTRFVRPSPKTKIWIGAGVGATTIVASSLTLISSLSAAVLLLRPFTILRTRMLIYWGSDQQTATEQPQGSYGRIVVTENASAIGATAIPDPSSTDADVDADWFVHQECIDRFIFGSGVGFIEGGHQYVVDSKAMRKVGKNDDVVAMFSETGGVGGLIITRGRALIQLH